MDKQQFRWLVDSCEDRRGRRLEKDKIYEAEDFPAAVLAQWVKTGEAEIIQAVRKARKEGDS
jgi:hypothetical protein